MPKHTKMEQEALAAARRGNQVTVDQKTVAGAAPVVTLREFTAGMTPAAAPGPLPEMPMQQEVPGLPTAPEVPLQKAGSQVPAEDLEAMKRALYGAGPEEAPAEPAAPAPAPKEEDMFQNRNCPRCGWQVDQNNVHVPTDADKLEFMESVLGSRPFAKEVELMGGRMRARFRMVTVTEEDAITEYLNQEMEAKRIQNTGEWTLAYNRARLVSMLTWIKLGNDEPVKYPTLEDQVKDEGSLVEQLGKRMKEIPKAWPLTTYGLMMQAMLSVTDVYSTLMARAYDANFWEGRTE